MLIYLSMLGRGCLVSLSQTTQNRVQNKTQIFFVFGIEQFLCCLWGGLDFVVRKLLKQTIHCANLRSPECSFGSDGKLSWTHLNNEPRHSTIIEVHFWLAPVLCGRQLSGSSSLVVNKWQAVTHCPCCRKKKKRRKLSLLNAPMPHYCVSQRSRCKKHWNTICLYLYYVYF